MSFEQIQLTKGGAIGRITLHRPAERNAMTPLMGREIMRAVEELNTDEAVRVVVITGAGKGFCSGADLRTLGAEAGSTDDAEGLGGGENFYRAFLSIRDLKVPSIAAINGHAVGVGITMTLPMDVRIVAEDAKIGFVFTRRGVVPEACSSWFLPRIVGISKAAEWVYTGRVFRASEEATSGLFNYVVPKEKVLDKAITIAREIAENSSTVSVALSKALLWHGLAEDDPQSVHLIDSRCFYWMGHQKDSHEGVESFLQKRPPKFPMKISSDMPDFYPWWKEPKV